MFDERYTALQAFGSAHNLAGWLGDHVTISQMVFAGGGSQEIVLVDNTTRARIFSLVTQQFR